MSSLRKERKNGKPVTLEIVAKAPLPPNTRLNSYNYSASLRIAVH